MGNIIGKCGGINSGRIGEIGEIVKFRIVLNVCLGEVSVLIVCKECNRVESSDLYVVCRHRCQHGSVFGSPAVRSDKCELVVRNKSCKVAAFGAECTVEDLALIDEIYSVKTGDLCSEVEFMMNCSVCKNVINEIGKINNLLSKIDEIDSCIAVELEYAVTYVEVGDGLVVECGKHICNGCRCVDNCASLVNSLDDVVAEDFCLALIEVELVEKYIVILSNVHCIEKILKFSDSELTHNRVCNSLDISLVEFEDCDIAELFSELSGKLVCIESFDVKLSKLCGSVDVNVDKTVCTELNRYIVSKLFSVCLDAGCVSCELDLKTEGICLVLDKCRYDEGSNLTVCSEISYLIKCRKCIECCKLESCDVDLTVKENNGIVEFNVLDVAENELSNLGKEIILYNREVNCSFNVGKLDALELRTNCGERRDVSEVSHLEKGYRTLVENELCKILCGNVSEKICMRYLVNVVRSEDRAIFAVENVVNDRILYSGMCVDILLKLGNRNDCGNVLTLENLFNLFGSERCDNALYIKNVEKLIGVNYAEEVFLGNV